ncbi:hypothetical protein CKAH01_14726 [Colletotrichum kahawae]|uniref:Uncharacterized protein n=1 Tax=Colletotrichum kahawae TaxID=34407 RepID=A0AAE0DC47_COLKA|nr:hypothetical protein CKAH01_14726 [Colletotrichum kahawae]
MDALVSVYHHDAFCVIIAVVMRQHGRVHSKIPKTLYRKDAGNSSFSFCVKRLPSFPWGRRNMILQTPTPVSKL